jgi:hypothetical protein
MLIDPSNRQDCASVQLPNLEFELSMSCQALTGVTKLLGIYFADATGYATHAYLLLGVAMHDVDPTCALHDSTPLYLPDHTNKLVDRSRNNPNYEV